MPDVGKVLSESWRVGTEGLRDFGRFLTGDFQGALKKDKRSGGDHVGKSLVNGAKNLFAAIGIGSTASAVDDITGDGSRLIRYALFFVGGLLVLKILFRR